MSYYWWQAIRIYIYNYFSLDEPSTNFIPAIAYFNTFLVQPSPNPLTQKKLYSWTCSHTLLNFPNTFPPCYHHKHPEPQIERSWLILSPWWQYFNWICNYVKYENFNTWPCNGTKVSLVLTLYVSCLLLFTNGMVFILWGTTRILKNLLWLKE